MPSNTFLNLPEHKQKRLLDAAKEEFSKHLMEEVSINQIIKNAGISRGSFYVYFKNKEDVYTYLLKQHHEIMLERILYHLEDTNGDFIETWEILFDEITTFCFQEKNIEFFRKIFLNLRFSTEKKRGHEKDGRKNWNQKILKCINKDLYRFESEEDLNNAFEMVMVMTNMSLVSTFMEQDKAAEEKKKFECRIRMLKYGLYKEEEKK